MAKKLEDRYTKKQIEFLEHCTYLDPRLKKKVEFDMVIFKHKVKEINSKASEIIPNTQSQDLENIETPTFATPNPRQVVPVTVTVARNTEDEDDFLKLIL